MPVINLLLSYVPPHVFEYRYGLVLPRSEGSFVKVTSEKLLTAYGTLRGFMTAGGRPDQARAARIILKDYVGGRLLYCEAPPGAKQEEFNKFDLESKRIWNDEDDQIAEARRLQQQLNGTKVEVNMKGAAHVKGHRKKKESSLTRTRERKN